MFYSIHFAFLFIEKIKFFHDKKRDIRDGNQVIDHFQFEEIIKEFRIFERMTMKDEL